MSMSNHFSAPSDKMGRRLRYVRFSITDRCNLKCSYCVNRERQRYIPHDDILRYEEIIRLAHIFFQMGVGKARITGGEPLARKGVVKFISTLRRRLPDLQIAITTNALLLPDYVDELASLGLCSFNISLDTFNRSDYARLTGSDSLQVVLKMVEKLLSHDQTVKLNAVALKGITDFQMGEFINFIKNNPVDVRFIEYMPMGDNTAWKKEEFISCDNLYKAASEYGALQPVRINDDLAGPARLYAVAGAKGRIGFISAISNHFCQTCQRARITSEGNMRLCLFTDKEIRLAPLLRHKQIGDANIYKTIISAYNEKPFGADLLAKRKKNPVAQKQMVRIGG